MRGSVQRHLPILLATAALLAPLGARAVDLPAPLAPFELGYFYADRPADGDFFGRTACFTDAYHAVVRRGYQVDSEEPIEVWLPRMRAALQRAVQAGKSIQVDLMLKDPEFGVRGGGRVTPTAAFDRVLDELAPFWGSISRLELADEPEGWTAILTENTVTEVVARLQARDLPLRPMGITLTFQQLFDHEPTNPKRAPGLDWIGIEAYLCAPDSPDCNGAARGSADIETNNFILRHVIYDSLASVPAGKSAVVVMQAYTRSGRWGAFLPQLEAMQATTYETLVDYQSFGDTPIDALLMFRYGAADGTENHPALEAAHREISEAILGPGPLPGCQGIPVGPHGLRVSAQGPDAHLSWSNGSGDPEHLRLLWRGTGYPDWMLGPVLDPGETSTTFFTGTLPGPAGVRERCFKVRARFGPGNFADSEEVCVNFYGSTPSEIPVLERPLGCTPDLAPLLEWSATARTDGYYLAVTRVASDTLVVQNQDLTAPSFHLSAGLEPDTRYRWKVKSCNNVGCGDWSAFGYFTAVCTPRADFDGDGASDLLLVDADTGEHLAGLLDGLAIRELRPLEPAQPAAAGWRAAAAADFDRDGDADLLWRNVASGNLAFWWLDGAVRVAGTALSGLPVDWELAGSGDFDLDGDPDLVWHRPATGELRVWRLAGAAIEGEATIATSWPATAGWRIEAVGDLNGDRWSDLVWRDPASGGLVLWNMNGTALVAPGSLTPSALADMNWRGISLIDVDRDGADDLVWSHQLSGAIVAWLMEGASRRSGGYLSAPESGTPRRLVVIGPR
jgi:hypothetical protein